jgi:hypothetical protein
MESPKIILNEVENHNERSGVIKKSRQNDVNSKASMIAELEDLLKVLADVSESENN